MRSDKWDQVKLGEVISLISGRDLLPEQYSDKEIGIPYITGASNIINGNVVINRWTDKPAAVSKIGDVLITCKGTVGLTAYNLIGDCHLARQVMALRPDNEQIETDYLKFAVDNAVDQLLHLARSMIPGISRKDILDMRIPLPPLPEQQRIASILSAADKAIEEAGLAVEESERIKSGLMQKLFPSGGNNIGLCGTQAYLGDIADITTGKLDSNAAVTGGNYPFFTCSPETLAINDYAFDCEAVLLAGNNASGKFNVKYYSGKFNAYQRTYIIQPKKSDQMDCQYLKNILSLRLTEMERLSIGSTTRFLTRKILDKFVIPIPALPEQKCIVDIISTADEQIALAKKRKSILEKTKQGLMQQLLGGNN